MENRRSLGIHNGTFHADEVTAAAMLIEFDLVDAERIVRTRDLGVLLTCEFVCDVGGIYNPNKKRFDHHQVEYQGELSSAGMILAYLRDTEVISGEVFDCLNSHLVHGVDLIDNGVKKPEMGFCSFSQVISNFMPISYDASDEEIDEAFFEALIFTRAHIGRLLKRFDYANSCKSIVENEMKKGGICMQFDRSMPWLEAFFSLGGEKSEARFLIMPTGSHWKLRGIPPTYDERMKVRQPLPKSWAGLLACDLKKETGIDGAIFCHKGRFISVWETKEDALLALNLALKGEDENTI